MLSHQIDGGQERPIAFASCTLSPAEKKYSQLEKEALAIIFAVTKFHHYLYGVHFTIQSDHQPLSFLFSELKGIPVMASSRIQRWALTLLAYQYSIQYKAGKTLNNADALSSLSLLYIMGYLEMWFISSITSRQQPSVLATYRSGRIRTLSSLKSDSWSYNPNHWMLTSHLTSPDHRS